MQHKLTFLLIPYLQRSPKLLFLRIQNQFISFEENEIREKIILKFMKPILSNLFLDGILLYGLNFVNNNK